MCGMRTVFRTGGASTQAAHAARPSGAVPGESAQIGCPSRPSTIPTTAPTSVLGLCLPDLLACASLAASALRAALRSALLSWPFFCGRDSGRHAL